MLAKPQCFDHGFLVPTNPTKGFLNSHGAGDAIALHVIAAKLRDCRMLAGGFGTCGHGFKAKTL